MSPVHEEVHEDAGERQQIEQRAKGMGAMFGEEQKAPDREEADEDKSPS
jgi:hypothetical protein